ncbi:T9SS type A sorting domain-containing protein [Flavivirga algicola]|uniref:T9SS type A sorting domain-containing protein n=1 Tax=Flavivirga algicola TaxID=2729136 RepID=A0ABX1RVQ6_9FLAO|nr:T9SS type A sorting domain-containing protein [Flavivirga algicola]NMH86574.1 T9SS type A sorting domain-containing protein [Flavivirga algicola]
MKKKTLWLFNVLPFILLFQFNAYNAQEVSVKIDFNCQRYLGDVSELDRTKYFSMHSSSTDTEHTTFKLDYNVTGGRGFWGPFSYANNQTGSVGVYPADRNGNDNLRAVREGFVATEHPRNAFIDGLNVISAGDWVVEYFKDFVDQNGRNEFFEVMNEPFVHADDFYSGPWSNTENDRIKKQMAEMYGEVGKRIHETPALDHMKVIGYSSAWPSMELNDFGHWNENMKMFMDTAGENMFGFSTHLYDGVNVTGQDTKRSGSNSEAILDLIENYSYVKWNMVKPHAITEYGAIEKGYGDDYSDIASVQTVQAINHILFNLLEREDKLVNSIPFITGKATWHITAENNYQPYQAVLFKPTNIGEPTPAGWEYTPRIHFYELWKDVKGKRVMITSDNPDVQAQAFADNQKLFVALNNLDDNTQTANLTMLSNLSGLVDVKIKALKIYPQTMPDMSIETVTSAPGSIDLIKGETVVLEYTFSDPIEFDNALRRKTYYSDVHLQPISANSEIQFAFDNVETGNGFATLRMSIGRKHNVSKKPIVNINGITIEVPDNWKGYDQANRDDFFGMIEIPFSAVILQETNTVSITFPDSGGNVSSLVLSVELYDNAPDTGILASAQSTGNACVGQSNGIITLNPLVVGSFDVSVTGNGVNHSGSFSATYNIENLASGTYTVVITSPTNPDAKTEYEITIPEPEPLSVTGKLNTKKNSVTYNLSGSDRYTINFNGEAFTTTDASIELYLQKGSNSIEIKAGKDCQGMYKDQLFLNEIVGYPNPFNQNLTIDLGLEDSATLKIYNTVGTLVYENVHNTTNHQIYLDTGFLKEGMYVIAVETAGISKRIKAIKISK